jgi:hypothetical protein
VRDMDNQTLIIILVVILVVGAGGFYGRGRWY